MHRSRSHSIEWCQQNKERQLQRRMFGRSLYVGQTRPTDKCWFYIKLGSKKYLCFRHWVYGQGTANSKFTPRCGQGLRLRSKIRTVSGATETGWNLITNWRYLDSSHGKTKWSSLPHRRLLLMYLCNYRMRVTCRTLQEELRHSKKLPKGESARVSKHGHMTSMVDELTLNFSFNSFVPFTQRPHSIIA